MQPEHGPQAWGSQPTYPAPPAQPPAPPAYYSGPGAPAHPPQAGGAGAPPPPPPWMVQYQPNAPAARKRGGPRKALVIGAIAVVGLLGAGTAGVNAFARHEVCSALEGDSTLTGSAGSEAPTAGQFEQVRQGADEMRGYSRMLVLDGDLSAAVDGLADDADQLVDVLSANGTGSVEQIAAGGGMAELLTLAGSINSHARAAQRACDLPVTGIFKD
ncbi:hypothetical protein [Paractinoplanes maris]|uniref:hypothetical protein n=1 Tax=Paractinoplanes maris TaxID=1734446 RepID=UPI002021D63B|nr:hypothetical protein [Actinoplanes maris]